jgi:hypothetical protein
VAEKIGANTCDVCNSTGWLKRLVQIHVMYVTVQNG